MYMLVANELIEVLMFDRIFIMSVPGCNRMSTK
jgi:hypothetical protein